MRPYFLIAALSLCFLGMSKKQTVSIRFHTETSKQDSETFAMPVKLQNLRRDTYLNRIPDLSERQIKGIMPFQSGDGTWGCVFQLDTMGKLRLDTLSSEHRGEALVVFVATKNGLHQVTDILIDRPVTDGIITIPSGLTDMEVQIMIKQFKPLQRTAPPAPEKKKKTDIDDWSMDSSTNPSAQPQQSPQPALPTQRLNDTSLPEVAPNQNSSRKERVAD